MHARSVSGILEGRKTQTRRIIKGFPSQENDSEISWKFGDGHSGVGWYWWETEYPDDGAWFEKCPYGITGDRLWVRERFALEYSGPGGSRVDARYADGLSKQRDLMDRVQYPVERLDWIREPAKWKPSIHMPRWASRLTLEITEIRVERVQDISTADCKAEGIQVDEQNHVIRPDDDINWGGADAEFAALWNETNGKGAWERNDWCWILTFRRLP